MVKVKDHIHLSKSVIRCKECKVLHFVRYLDDALCESCEKRYRKTLNKIVYGGVVVSKDQK